jgi:hypothetical protein
VNFIRTNAKNRREFRNFIEELELEEKPSDLSFYCIVRWLSTQVQVLICLATGP